MKPGEYLPCPHCGSTNLTLNQWSMDEGEVDAIECDECKAGSPASVWSNRVHDDGVSVAKVEQ